MRQIFEEETYLRFQLLFESAVSIAQSQSGLIPKKAAIEINSKANIKNITVKRWREIEKITHHETASLVESIVEVVNTEAKPWVHYGLTSNDVVVLSPREATDGLLTVDLVAANSLSIRNGTSEAANVECNYLVISKA